MHHTKIYSICQSPKYYRIKCSAVGQREIIIFKKKFTSTKSLKKKHLFISFHLYNSENLTHPRNSNHQDLIDTDLISVGYLTSVGIYCWHTRHVQQQIIKMFKSTIGIQFNSYELWSTVIFHAEPNNVC